MRHGVLISSLFLLLAACVPADETQEEVAAVVRQDTVILETTAGDIVIALDAERAPISVENFLLHVRSGFYDGLVFHRVEAGFVIQTGEVDAENRKRVSTVFPIENEARNGLVHGRGTVGMARSSGPHSATSQFFVNLSDNTEKLDFKEATATGWGYAVFGAVVSGMDVVDSIARIPTRRQRAYANFPTKPVFISRAYIK